MAGKGGLVSWCVRDLLQLGSTAALGPGPLFLCTEGTTDLASLWRVPRQWRSTAVSAGAPQSCFCECSNYILSVFFIPWKIFTFSLEFLLILHNSNSRKSDKVPGGDRPRAGTQLLPSSVVTPPALSLAHLSFGSLLGLGWGLGGVNKGAGTAESGASAGSSHP